MIILKKANEDKLSNDLLYRSPNYPILNVTDDETCLNLGENSIVIKKYQIFISVIPSE